MRRPVFTALVLGAVAVLPGCPIYDHDDGDCYSSDDCAPDFRCDDRSGDCYPEAPKSACREPAECGVNETCSTAGQCVTGDCSFSGCVRGYVCDSSSERWECVEDTGAAGARNAPSPSSASGAAGESPLSAAAGAAGGS